MKLTSNLSFNANPAQRCATAYAQTNAAPFTPLAFARAHSTPPLRVPPPPATYARPVLRGNRHYLRALRAAEMAAWEAGQPFDLGQFAVG